MVDVRLERFPVEVVRALVDGTLDRPADWHPEYATASITGIARMLLTAHEAMNVPDASSPW